KLSELSLPQVRLGLVKREYFGKYIVDVGLDKEVAVKGSGIKEGSVIPVLLEKITNSYIWGKQLSYKEVVDMGIYPGYEIVRIKGNIVDYLRKFRGLKIATSRKGVLITNVFNELLEKIKETEEILVLFGSHSYGLYEIFNAYNTRLEDQCDYSLNMIPKQYVETVRTEEAVFISLAILKLIEYLASA
ncbi:MAG: putative RNA uridine N3 methyltransferase, partial [Candidatus Geothermarchaeota archaeon]